ncbi:hypothetical protein EK21DRAFT_77953 [Setomelanomma holmii]|uniref:Uncharacterized protein n=1 Tax=Setomelanomma holmii TaxID=210430 RepID=A0A9P4GY44_9PLEO|nr:hypothetical protein EK21DRAFT_77953 [Setomelanomma holmii]
MRPSRNANEYRDAILSYGERSYTKTMFHGFIYRFLVELLKNDETELEKKCLDLNEYTLAHFTYIRGHAILDDSQFLIEQDISITVESDGDGWTDVGSRDLLQSQDLFSFLNHLEACLKTGLRWIRMTPTAFLGFDAELKHPLPTEAHGRVPSNALDDGCLVLPASHLPHEFHLILDYEVAALDPLYALHPVFKFAAHTFKTFLGDVMRRYEIISSTLWDQKLSEDHMQQLILSKHLLDDNACRHEQVLRFLRTPRLVKWGEKLNPGHKEIADEAKRDVENDYEYLLRRCREYSEHHQTAINILVNATALAESKKQISLATQVTKLTVLATIFLPLSFCTSIFGMNFIELNNLSIWVWALVTVCIGIVTLVVYMWDERESMFERLGRILERWFGRKERIRPEQVMMA